MSNLSLSYEFAGLRFSPEAMQLEVLESGDKINLTPTHCRFLLVLLKTAPETVTFEHLRQSVWTNQIKTDESLKRLIQTTKGDFVKSLKQLNVETDFIEPVTGEGYRLIAPITIDNNFSNTSNFAALKPFSVKEFPTDENEFTNVSQTKYKNYKNGFFGQHAAFVLLASVFYGLLYWLALLLEIAYQFDFYGTQSLQIGLPLVLWIGGTMFFGLRSAENLVCQKNRFGFLAGLAFLFGGTFLACLALSFFLPNEPITAARFQSQPAFAAFVKNSLIYFLPLGVVFILIPFHYVCVRENPIFSDGETESTAQKNIINLRFAFLFGLWLLALAYSIFSTFYLLDNLLPAPFHALFVVLAFLRFFVYFGLSLACLLWYKSALNFAAQ